jgi:hypothetical protein
MKETGNAYNDLVEREGKKSFAIPTHRWDDIKMDLTETGGESMDWIESVPSGGLL